MELILNNTYTDKQVLALYNGSEYGSRYELDGISHYKIGLNIFARAGNDTWRLTSTQGIKNICNTIRVGKDGKIV